MKAQLLDGKVALVTGASRGIGAAISKKLAATGASVIINYAGNESKAREVAEEITHLGGNSKIIQADLSEPSQIPVLFEKAELAYGGIDILVNNAGRFDAKPLQQTDAELYTRLFDLNVRGSLLATAEAAKRLRSGGRIITITSIAARGGSGEVSVYAGSKAALEAMTRSWATDLGQRQITVNAIAPGPVETDMFHQGSMSDEVLQQQVALTALGRLGQPDDIADAVMLLCTDYARWITGQVIDVNGGMHF